MNWLELQDEATARLRVKGKIQKGVVILTWTDLVLSSYLISKFELLYKSFIMIVFIWMMRALWYKYSQINSWWGLPIIIVECLNVKNYSISYSFERDSQVYIVTFIDRNLSWIPICLYSYDFFILRKHLLKHHIHRFYLFGGLVHHFSSHLIH